MDLQDYCRSKGPGSNIRYYPQVGSTNDVALATGAAGAAEGLVIVADEQTAGRGRLDRRWVAPPGSCLLMSLLFRPPAPFAYHAARTTMLCGVALIEAIGEVVGVAAGLKWPNDVVIAPPDAPWRKVGGMLSEIRLEAETPTFLVVGMGLNVNVPARALASLSPQAGSLCVEAGRELDRVTLLDALLSRIEAHYAALRAGRDPLPLWRKHLVWIGREVQVHTPTQIVTGVAEDVDDEGALLVRDSHGKQRRFPVGDVSLRV